MRNSSATTMVDHDLFRRGMKKPDEQRTAKQLIVGVLTLQHGLVTTVGQRQRAGDGIASASVARTPCIGQAWRVQSPTSDTLRAFFSSNGWSFAGDNTTDGRSLVSIDQIMLNKSDQKTVRIKYDMTITYRYCVTVTVTTHETNR